MRQRDPRRLLGAAPARARAREASCDVPQSGYAPGRQRGYQAGGRGHAAARGARAHLVARVPRAPGAHLLALPHARLARAAARALHARARARSCCSAGPFVLLRFLAPEYETEADGGTVTLADRPRACSWRRPGAARATCGSRCERRAGRADGDRDVTGTGHLGGRQLLPADRRLGLVRAHRPHLLPDHAAAHPRDRDPRVPALAGATSTSSRRVGARRRRSAQPLAAVISRSFARSWRAVIVRTVPERERIDDRLGGRALAAR